MGFDFGDADPAQESPAAGFRIKSLKPASKADSGRIRTGEGQPEGPYSEKWSKCSRPSNSGRKPD